MNDFTSLIREDLHEFKAYSSARKEASTGKIFLNANESPWENTICFDQVKSLNRYPEPQPKLLIDVLSKFYHIESEQLLLTSGSDVGIDLLIRLFCQAGRDSVLICQPTYGMYEISARLQGANVITVDLSKIEDFSLNFQAIENVWNPSVKLIFLCSPNNPTGNLLNKKTIFDLCEHYMDKSIIVVDEAYIEYAKTESLINNMNEYKNLVILRTFSKALGFAGIRCGALMAHRDLIAFLNKIITPYPVSTLAYHAALQVFSEGNYERIRSKILLIQSERERLYQFFNQSRWIKKVWKSEANFILAESKNSNALLEECLQNGIVLRDMQDKPGLKNCIRISIGSPDENNLLMEILK